MKKYIYIAIAVFVGLLIIGYSNSDNIDELKETVSSQNETITELTEELEHKNSQIEELNAVIEEKDSEIESLTDSSSTSEEEVLIDIDKEDTTTSKKKSTNSMSWEEYKEYKESKKESDTNSSKSAEETKYDYVFNKNTKVFHYYYCSSVSKMKEKNKREITATRDEMINKGYKPCGRCNP